MATGTKSKAKTSLASALKALERHASARTRAQMPRYGIVTKDRVFGVSMGNVQIVAKSIGPDHTLAEQLGRSKIYEGRMLAAFIDDPALVTPAQMDRWAKDFDNWAACDTACFKLFDRTPHAFAKIRKWAIARDEFVKRAAFALLASCALHHKKMPDAEFLAFLPLTARAASDERNFVKKSVSWALRGIGKRAGARADVVKLAKRLALSKNATERWIGKDVLRGLKA